MYTPLQKVKDLAITTALGFMWESANGPDGHIENGLESLFIGATTYGFSKYLTKNTNPDRGPTPQASPYAAVGIMIGQTLAKITNTYM